MAIPRKKKKVTDINAAVQKAAKQEPVYQETISSPDETTLPGSKKTGRPSPRSGNVERMTLLLTEDTAERLTIAFAAEKVKRKKQGEKIDKSLLIEEIIIDWIESKEF